MIQTSRFNAFLRYGFQRLYGRLKHGQAACDTRSPYHQYGSLRFSPMPRTAFESESFSKESIRAQKGALVLQVLIFSTVGIVILSGFILWTDIALKSAHRDSDQALAFAIAEAGIEYYRWHLAHNPVDYKDGTGQPGPYVHDFKDRNNNVIGHYSLEITPPPVGSTVVTIISTGTITANPAITKKIQIKLAIPTLGQYAVVTNDEINFGAGTQIYGQIHSNGGIHFDGVAHGLVTSAKDVYNDPDHSGNEEFGVHTHTAPVDPMPPAAVPSRPDVFQAGRTFPVPAVDFTGIIGNLADIKASAQLDGYYYAPSNDDGYHMVLKTNDTYDLYKVTKIKKAPSGCTEVLGQEDWGTWTIETETFIHNRAIPPKGLIFLEDDLWVDGTIQTARFTIAVARFPENPSTHANITVNKDLAYTTYDGQDSIGLIAQGNFTVGLESEDDLTVAAAIIAYDGRVGRHYYKGPQGGSARCSPWHIRHELTFFGIVASNERYGFAYSDGTGYQSRILTYDVNMIFNPPPLFPSAQGGYQQIQWLELQ